MKYEGWPGSSGNRGAQNYALSSKDEFSETGEGEVGVGTETVLEEFEASGGGTGEPRQNAGVGEDGEKEGGGRVMLEKARKSARRSSIRRRREAFSFCSWTTFCRISVRRLRCACAIKMRARFSGSC